MYVYTHTSMMKLFIRLSILSIFIHFSELKACMMPGFFFYMFWKLSLRFFFVLTKNNLKFNFQNNSWNMINLTGKLCKIGKVKIIHAVENIVLNWSICVSIINLHNYFIGDAFLTIYSVEYLWQFQQRISPLLFLC